MQNCDGLILTMPHKQAMCACVDELRDNGRLVGAINAARRLRDGRWGETCSTAAAMWRRLRKSSHRTEGKRVHLIGAGGVARAMAMALAQGGIASLTLRDIDACRAKNLAAAVGAAFPNVRAEVVTTDQYDCDILANATPLGMREGDPPPCEPSRIAAATVVTDVIPKPDITPLLTAAQARGCTVVTGREMVEGQVELIAEFFGFPSSKEI